MKSKNYTSLFLLLSIALFTSSCSKEENIVSNSKQFETSPRNAQTSIKDSLENSWFVTKIERIITVNPNPNMKPDTVTTNYKKGDYVILFYKNGIGMEMIKQEEGGYQYIPFTYEETGNHHITVKEQNPGSDIFNFGVHFPNQRLEHVRLTETTDGAFLSSKTIWHLSAGTTDTRH